MNKIIIAFCILMIFVSPCGLRGEEPKEKNIEIAGEMFFTPVPLGNYYFAKRTLMVFGTKWGPEPTNQKELEDRIWEDLLLSYEAFRQGIEVNQQELEDEITNTLKVEKVEFNWKENKDAFDAWLKEKINENREIFANQLKYLIQLKKLRQQVLDSITPEVTEEEAFQKFLDEYNTLETELAQFENQNEAQDFYKKAKSNPKFWEEQTKDNPKLFRRPGFVALEFLWDMWKYPKDDLYKMLEAKTGTIYPPIPIYTGKYGVVRILKVRLADKSEFEKQRQSYYEKIKMRKKYEGLNDWLKKLKEEANIRIYVLPQETPKETKATADTK
jgi:hypothetical protein